MFHVEQLAWKRRTMSGHMHVPLSVESIIEPGVAI